MKILIDIPTDQYNEIVYVNYERLRDIVRDGVVIEKCEDAISREEVLEMIEAIHDAGGFVGYNTYSEAFDRVDNMPPVTPQRPQGKWIPTTERLPDNNQTEYLVTYKRKGKLWINIGFCDDGDWYLYSNDEGPNWEPYVIAWMPLPEPYKREDDEE